MKTLHHKEITKVGKFIKAENAKVHALTFSDCSDSIESCKVNVVKKVKKIIKLVKLVN